MEARVWNAPRFEIGSKDEQVGLRATGQVVKFDGFLARL